MTETKSQILGLSLALATAVSCIFYEKLVHNFSFKTILALHAIDTLLLLILANWIFKDSFIDDYRKFVQEPKYILWFGISCLMGITSVFWYVITKSQGVMVGSIYEIKYIVILAVLYILFGDEKFTWNTFIGVTLALSSIYFISKN